MYHLFGTLAIDVWVGQIKIKDQLSPAEAVIGAELGNINKSPKNRQDPGPTTNTVQLDKTRLESVNLETFFWPYSNHDISQ